MFKIIRIKRREFNEASYKGQQKKLSKQHSSTSTNFPPLISGHKKIKYLEDYSCQTLERQFKEKENISEYSHKSAFLMGHKISKRSFNVHSFCHKKQPFGIGIERSSPIKIRHDKNTTSQCFYKNFNFKQINEDESHLIKALQHKLLSKKLDLKEINTLNKYWVSWKTNDHCEKDLEKQQQQAVSLSIQKLFELYLEFLGKKTHSLVLKGKMMNEIITPFLLVYSKACKLYGEKNMLVGLDLNKGNKESQKINESISKQIKDFFKNHKPQQSLKKQIERRSVNRRKIYENMFEKYEANPFYIDSNQTKSNEILRKIEESFYFEKAESYCEDERQQQNGNIQSEIIKEELEQQIILIRKSMQGEANMKKDQRNPKERTNSEGGNQNKPEEEEKMVEENQEKGQCQINPKEEIKNKLNELSKEVNSILNHRRRDN